MKKLENAIGAENVKTSKMERLLYSHDSTGLPKEVDIGFKVIPDYVVRPTSTEDVQKIVKIAADTGVPITPRGAATGYVAAGVPAAGGISIDMVARMSKILKVDEENMTITCQAGASWKAVMEAAAEKGLFLGSYPSSFPNASVAGWIAMSGVGMGNYKYGSAGDNIRNMVIVVPSGAIINTGFETLADNMTGYNLNRLFVGTEGTLGVICEVTLKLFPKPEVLRPLAYSFERLDKVGAPMKDLTRTRVMPLHVAWSDGNHFKYLGKIGHHAPKVGCLWLVTLEGDKAICDYEEKIIDEIVAKHGGKKESSELAQHEWDERSYEYRTSMLGLGTSASEILVPVSAYADAVNGLYDLMDKMKMEGAIIGVAVDRNSIMLMPYYLFDKESLTKSMTSLSFAFKAGEVAKDVGGRLMGGFGLFMSSQLKPLRGEGYNVQVAIKNALDPKEIMNPGKLLGMETRFKLPVTAGLFGVGMGAMSVVKKVLPKDNMIDEKSKELALEELEKERFEQHRNDPLKKK
ncbi:MAG: FAD-binding oxidoreductase [Methanomassiliicoccus sp.]|nr:FAD-binding oxidoreductase [Methanomassiliicoccus sp.]